MGKQLSWCTQSMMQIKKMDERFPKPLSQSSFCPKALYCAGNQDLFRQKAVAIIGTRNMTAYGKQATRHFVRQAVEQGWCVVSGLAVGVDQCVHESTLEFGGKTIAVVAGGLSQITPQSNEFLARNILKQGGLVCAEYDDAVPTEKWRYLQRNRIIAGMCSAVIVVEAGFPSGTFSTVNWALQLGRDAFVISGPYFSPYAEGTKILINNGAMLITSLKDVHDELRMPYICIKRDEKTTEFETKMLETMRQFPTGARVDEVVALGSFDRSTCLSALFDLEMRGIVVKNGAKYMIAV
ncbi:MAG: protecting protein DprA protein [Microgenomates group bacterium GW2011_GWF2_45_18]|nr:MAG: protecting protein DprA protein [Microgenomates group bacterium GW2011_GWF1_44_10]KKU01370.1 MAG: protecting protein DprA protein [Microgenomates group bacterium GW2011_GWF2_45_18]HAU98622.1 DNA-protecting protein DprA [Candidatus Paceibacterota bacterium]